MTSINMSPLDIGIRPIVKWAGGKRRLISELLSHDVGPVETYYEPFLGGGAMMLALPLDTPRKICDANADLINLYLTVRDSLEDLLSALQHMPNEPKIYNEIRGWDRLPNWNKKSNIEKSARFLYLNKTAFNGLHRVNRAGEFNVPFGRYKNPKILDRPNLESFSKFLNQKNAEGSFVTEIHPANSFDSFLKNQSLRLGDFVYLDPPYAPLPNSQSFVSYQAGGFSDFDQRRVMEVALESHERGAKVMLSNSSAPMILELYEEILGPTGDFNIEFIQASRNIAAAGSARAAVAEAVIRNY